MSSAAAQDLSFGLEPPLSPESIGGLRTATPVAPPHPQLQQPLRQPVAPPAPDPVAAAAPEPAAASAPEPVAAPVPEQAATPTVAPPLPTLGQPAPASESTAGVHVELHVRLTNGERIRIDSFPNQEAAKTRARQMCRELEESRVWPLLAGRFVRPDAVVSIDLDLTAR